jgi:hypothetical protein
VKESVRNVAITLITRVLRHALGALVRVVPRTRLVVVAAFPQSEGNGVEVARALLHRYPGRVVWLREGEIPGEVAELVTAGLLVVGKNSLRGLWCYLRAELVFFTHGLYGSPAPPTTRPVVNVWHGDGPKGIIPDGGTSDLIRSTYLVGSTTLFSRHQADALEVPPENVLVTGNPRTDQFRRPTSDAQLRELGIRGDFVLWLPTFRVPRAVGAVRTGEGVRDEPSELVQLLAGSLGRRGLQLVVKPHPMDQDRRREPGVVTLEQEDLQRAGTGLYPLLARSSGLVTDYSSVWVDYLLLDRPLAFLVPDRTSYDRPLFPPDVLDWVPGEVVGSQRPFETFLADLDMAGRAGTSLRRDAADRIGLCRDVNAADGLLTALAERGVLDVASSAEPGPDGSRTRPRDLRNGLSRYR